MRVITALVIFCLFAAGQSASVQTRTISGTVVDPAGQGIPGVSIELRNGRSAQRRTTSDTAGAWKFENVEVGSYVVRFALSGFVTTDLHLKVGDVSPSPARVVLKVGAVSETVTVTGATTVVDNLGYSSPAAPPPPPTAKSSTAGFPFGGLATGAAGGSVPGGQYMPHPQLPYDTASYAEIHENRFRLAKDHPLSTFSIDVDTASYSNVRRFLNEGRLPPADAVRIEELINYFRFDYPTPRNGAPVSVTTELGAAPWNPKHRLALVGLRSTPIRQEKTPPRNLTFLLDVSGSMAPVNRLPLVKTAMRMLVDTLRAEDKVAIVVYAGASGLCLPATSGEEKHRIQAALERLSAGGSTNGASGIQLAYNIASENFIRGGINRVILATDGDFNVGVTSQSELTRLIEEKRERGIFLSVLGVGDNNLKDSTMEMLADKGNGNYSYLDSIQEARRVLIKEAGATLVTVAKDVKLQIEFNPSRVAGYRLIGYENRLLRKEDFNNDRKDAGEMGAGHTVTALYELVPAGERVPAGDVDPLKYQRPTETVASQPTQSNDLMNIKIRYKAPDGDTSKLLEFPVRDAAARTTPNLGFASAVAGFGMLLRRSEFKGLATWEQAASLARQHRGEDDDGYRAEFIRLIELAAALSIKNTTSVPDFRR
jgi:Ca-activated chloride channel family protein